MGHHQLAKPTKNKTESLAVKLGRGWAALSWAGSAGLDKASFMVVSHCVRRDE